jgi:hypothetical protein
MKVILVINFCFLFSVFSYAQRDQDPQFEVVNWDRQPVIKEGDPGTQGIECGFEGGTVVKVDGTYHLFPTERIGIYCSNKTRIGHWESTDGIHWERISTILESSGDTLGNDRRAVFYAAIPIFDEEKKAWNLFYVSYKYRRNPPRGYHHQDGQIWRAVSSVSGEKGIGGPYQDIAVVLQPDKDSQPWEGHQGVDSFYPFQSEDKWYGFYGSAKTEVMPEKPCSFWAIGVAESCSLAGPWTRCKSGNPIELYYGDSHSMLMPENPIVYRLNDGWYIALIDYIAGEVGKDDDQPTYMVSDDGLHWSLADFFRLNPASERWWREMVTPLALIEEDQTFTLFFTARDSYLGFESIGRAKIKRK